MYYIKGKLKRSNLPYELYDKAKTEFQAFLLLKKYQLRFKDRLFKISFIKHHS